MRAIKKITRHRLREADKSTHKVLLKKPNIKVTVIVFVSISIVSNRFNYSTRSVRG